MAAGLFTTSSCGRRGQEFLGGASLSLFLIKENLINKFLHSTWSSHFINIQTFSSAIQSCPTLCDPMDCSTPGLPDHHQLPEFTQTHIHQVGDAIQPSHPLTQPVHPPAQTHTDADAHPQTCSDIGGDHPPLHVPADYMTETETREKTRRHLLQPIPEAFVQ